MCKFFGFASFQILEFLPWLQYFGHEAHKSIIRTKKRSEAFFSKLMEQTMVKKLLIDLWWEKRDPHCTVSEIHNNGNIVSEALLSENIKKNPARKCYTSKHWT